MAPGVSESLWFTVPGGIRVATEEAIVLGDSLGRARELVGHSSEALAGISSDLGLAIACLRHTLSTLIDDCDTLRDALDRYAMTVADHERWRTELLDRSRDAVINASLRGLLPVGGSAEEAQGRNSWSHIDDAASLFLGGTTYRAPLVTVSETHRVEGVSSPSGLAERLARIPPGETPIRIDRYGDGGEPGHVEVYIAGTQDWGVGSSSHPFDLGSNLALVAGVSGAALVATELALRRAGVTPQDRVVFVGHSQGGAVAATLAESGRYRTAGLVTFGAPTGTLPVRGDYPAVLIEHSDDVVPTLGGARHETRALVVQTASEGTTSPHSRDSYQHTAERIDRSRASVVHDARLPTPEGVAVSRVFEASQETSRTSSGGEGERTVQSANSRN